MGKSFAFSCSSIGTTYVCGPSQVEQKEKGRERNVTNRGNVESEQANVFWHWADIVQSLHHHRVRPKLLQEVVALLHECCGVRFDGII